MAGRPKLNKVNFHRRVTPDEKLKLTKYLNYLREQTITNKTEFKNGK